jgi:ATP-dependent helicase HrpB
VEHRRTLMWEGDRLVNRIGERLDGLELRARSLTPIASDEVTAALVARIRERGLALLPWTELSTSWCQRVQFVAAARPDDGWPDWSEAALTRGLADWLGPFLVGATGWHDVELIDLTGALLSRLSYERRVELDRLAPQEFQAPNGRRHRITYGDSGPEVSLRVQDVFGQRTHPCILDGQVPIRMVLLSPAQRPVQITSDLPGLWQGSWADIRKDMAGRYPKHSWPIDPTQM